MSDNNHGGIRPGAGRPPKAEEDKISSFAIAAIVSIFGSEKEGFEALAEKAKKGSFNHQRLLFEYAYGKPKEEIIDMQPVIIWEEKLVDVA